MSSALVFPMLPAQSLAGIFLPKMLTLDQGLCCQAGEQCACIWERAHRWSSLCFNTFLCHGGCIRQNVRAGMGAWGCVRTASGGLQSPVCFPLVWTEDTSELLALLTVVWPGGDTLVRAVLFAFRAGL